MSNWQKLVETLVALYRNDTYSLAQCNNLCHVVESKKLTDKVVDRVMTLQEQYNLKDSLILACSEYNIVL